MLTKTKKKGTGSELQGKFIHIWSGAGKEKDSKKRSFDCSIKSKWKQNIITVEEINERILKTIIKVHSAECVIIAVCGPNEQATHGENGDFYVHTRKINRKIRSEQNLIIIGDLNGKVKSKTNNRRGKRGKR